MTGWVQKFIEGDVSLIVDTITQRDKVQNVTSSLSLVEISNDIKLSEIDKQDELIKMHEQNISILKKQLREKDGIITENESDIKSLIKLLEKNNVKLDSVIETNSRLEKYSTETLGKLNIVENKLDVVENKLDVVENKLDVVENKLDVVENKLDKAVSSVIERTNNKKYNNYLCIYKLRVPEYINNTNYKYYVTRSKTELKRDKYMKYIIDYKYEKVICEIKLNHSVNSWYIIKDTLVKEGKILGHRNYFFIYENNGISVISEKELAEKLNDTIVQNKNRIKQ